jgi:NitT/TauT family transport system permease protein
MTRDAAGAVAAPLVTLVAALLLWQGLVTGLELPPFLVPSPGAVAAEAIAQRALLASATWVTLREAVAGFGISAVGGTALAFLFTRARWIERSLVPYAVFLQTVPVVAIAPLLVLWFGVGFQAVVASSVIVAVFPVITSATAGLRSVDPDLRALFRLYRASRWQTFVRLEAPSAVPYLAAGLRSASGLAVIGAVVGEFVAGHAEGEPGLGYVILSGYRQLQTPLLFGAVMCCSALGLVLFAAVSLAGQRWMARWHASSGG